MKPGLKIGTERELSFTVTEDMCPAFDGVVVHRVCATWTLVHYFEVAGRKMLVDFLADGEEGVGSHASCDHRAPAPIGETVRVVATCCAVNERELVCDCVAYVGEKKIATGQTGQRVFPKKVLKRLLGDA